MHRPCPQNNVGLRIARQQIAQRLTIAVPQFLSRDAAAKRPKNHPPHHQGPRIVQQNDCICAIKNEVSHLRVIAINHPRVRRETKLEGGDEVRVTDCRPLRLVMNSVELDVRRFQARGE